LNFFGFAAAESKTTSRVLGQNLPVNINTPFSLRKSGNRLAATGRTYALPLTLNRRLLQPWDLYRSVLRLHFFPERNKFFLGNRIQGQHRPKRNGMETKKFDYRAVVIIALAVVAGVVLFALKQKKSSVQSFAPAGPEIGRSAPDFRLPGLDGKMVSLSDYRGKVVLVNIWATWCPPCVDEMPSMEKLYQQLLGEAFEILAVSIDEQGAGVVAPFMKKHNLSFLALSDTKGIVKNLYYTTGVPESLIIDKSGNVVEKIIGPRDWATPEAIKYFRDLSKNQ
jgi:peroxiredoxin